MKSEKPVISSRSFNMSRIRGKNTRAELTLRRLLWRQGVRYRIHTAKVFGRPDILIRKYRLAIFVDGGFWHGYNWSEKKAGIKTNRAFWHEKIEKNMQRDIQVNNFLRASGWTIMRFWDHEIFREPARCVNQILLFLESAKTGIIPEKE